MQGEATRTQEEKELIANIKSAKLQIHEGAKVAGIRKRARQTKKADDAAAEAPPRTDPQPVLSFVTAEPVPNVVAAEQVAAMPQTQADDVSLPRCRFKPGDVVLLKYKTNAKRYVIEDVDTRMSDPNNVKFFLKTEDEQLRCPVSFPSDKLTPA